MMSSHDDDVHNPPRRGTRSWSTPDPVSRGRRYSHSRRKNEKGGFNKRKSQSFSPRKIDEREREREREREKEKREESAPSNYTLSQRAHSRVIAYTIVKVITSSTPTPPLKKKKSSKKPKHFRSLESLNEWTKEAGGVEAT